MISKVEKAFLKNLFSDCISFECNALFYKAGSFYRND